MTLIPSLPLGVLTLATTTMIRSLPLAVLTLATMTSIPTLDDLDPVAR